MYEKFCFVILIVTVFDFCTKIDAKEVACEKVTVLSWGEPIGKAKTCHMMHTTTINEPGATISSRDEDEAMAGLSFYTNMKIFYLPESVDGIFPNLMGYSAPFCFVKEISKVNFQGLKKVKFLYLQYNQIEKIPSNTFEDLVELEKVELRKKKYEVVTLLE